MNDTQSIRVQQIKRITESIISLPTLPTVVSKMIELVDNPKTSAASLARLISTDQALTARILKLANSAYYGFPREISTVNMAIVVLGFNTVKDMGLSLSVLDVFKGGPDSFWFDVAKYWEHSIGCGVAARMLARKYWPRLAAEAFVAGLLHDIGKIILNQYAPKEFAEVMSAVAQGPLELDEAELKIIGTGHAQVGAWLAEKWKLPRIIVEGIKYHHCPWEAQKEPALIGLITLSDFLCHKNAIGKSGRKSIPIPDPHLWALFATNGISLNDMAIDDLSEQFLVEYDQAETFRSFITDV